MPCWLAFLLCTSCTIRIIIIIITITIIVIVIGEDLTRPARTPNLMTPASAVAEI